MRKSSALDWIRIGLLIAGILCVLTRLLPAPEAEDSLRRIAPLLVFLGSVIVLAKLARQAQVFDVIATRMAIVGRGNYLALFLLCVTFASIATCRRNHCGLIILSNVSCLGWRGRPASCSSSPSVSSPSRLAILRRLLCSSWSPFLF
ncbi:MAG TPA: hypothetical protein VJT72_19245 [Pseudonocardiaceae bacterium]|nr:hypothetical protein [Pseudonocardiaceae bacterium]